MQLEHKIICLPSYSAESGVVGTYVRALDLRGLNAGWFHWPIFRIFVLLLQQNDRTLTRKKTSRFFFFFQKNVEYTCQTLGNLNMGNFEKKSDNLPHCLRQKFLPLYTSWV